MILKNSFLVIYLQKVHYFLTRWLIKTIFVYKNWITVYCDYFSPFFNKPYVLKTRKGLKLWINSKSGDVFICNEMLLANGYEEKDLDINIRKNDVVLDVGAHIGCFSVMAASLF